MNKLLFFALGLASCGYTGVHAADSDRGCDERLTRAQCRNGEGCTFVKEINKCFTEADAAALTTGFEPGKPGEVYQNDPCIHFGPKQCLEASMCIYKKNNKGGTDVDGFKQQVAEGYGSLCEFLPVGQRASSRKRDSFTHKMVADKYGLHNYIADMTCGEAFSKPDCQTLNEHNHDENTLRNQCKWGCVNEVDNAKDPVCYDKAGGATPSKFCNGPDHPDRLHPDHPLREAPLCELVPAATVTGSEFQPENSYCPSWCGLPQIGDEVNCLEASKGIRNLAGRRRHLSYFGTADTEFCDDEPCPCWCDGNADASFRSGLKASENP